MAFSNWKSLKKIDAHIHILPDAVHEANPDSEDAWLHTTLCQYRGMMDEMNIEKESQKDIKANLISRKNILLTIIAVIFSPLILIIRLLVLKIGKIENKRLVILINTLLFIIIGIYLKSLKDNVYFVFLGIIAISYSLYSFYKLSLEIKKD